jgi:hypothetical protein
VKVLLGFPGLIQLLKRNLNPIAVTQITILFDLKLAVLLGEVDNRSDPGEKHRLAAVQSGSRLLALIELWNRHLFMALLANGLLSLQSAHTLSFVYGRLLRRDVDFRRVH